MKLKNSVAFSFIMFLMFIGISFSNSVFAETIVPQGTTAILNDQFSGRKDLVDVVIPKSVERIYPGAFYLCTSLRSITFEESSVLKYIDDSVFQNCKNLERINLPDSLINVNAKVFWDCTKLPTSLVLPATLEKIETTAFFNTKLQSVTLPAGCRYQSVDHGFPYAPSFPESCVVTGGIAYDFYAHLALPLPEIKISDETSLFATLVQDERFVVPQGATAIEGSAFSQRADLVHIIIPKSIKKIGSSAFYDCSNLKTVDFEEGSQVKCIDYFTFQNCSALEKVNFPEGLLQIRAHSFWGCTKLIDVHFPSSMRDIDANSFFISKLERVTLPKTCRYQAFEHGFPNAAAFPENCIIVGGTPRDYYTDRPFPIRSFLMSEIKATPYEPGVSDRFIVPQGATKIESTQFVGRTDIVDIVIPKSVQVICPGAFYMCTNLKSVTFEEGSMLKYIESYAFQNCHSIEKIILPEGTIQIRAHAFWACQGLIFAHIPSTMKAVDCSAFYTTKLSKVILPTECIYQGIRHGFPHEKSFPENCVVEGGVCRDLYVGV
ncbi:MAG: leucine-rich repeat domain-containing protein [Oscillospiraceae bacterium]|jgi:hypothetical protein|nr:leucine-rich repeat domain-containing protein [Oscillospiraceae bacterium]